MKKTIFEKTRSHVLPVAVLLSVTLSVYARTLGHEFILNWDDIFYIVENETIRGITLEHVKDAFTRFYVGNYAPLHIISYMLDYSLWDLNPAGYIFVNMFIHALNGVLFYFLLFRLNRSKALGVLAAFIFLVHPVQVESVAWVSQRKNLLAMFFFLGSFHFYVSYRHDRSQRGNFFYVSSILAFILALLSKSAAIVLPLVLFLYDLCYLDRSGRKAWVTNKIPYLLAVGASAFITLKSQSPELGGGRISYYIEGPLSVFYTMLTVLVLYLKLLIWPADLSALYMPSMKYGIDGAVAGSIVLSALLIAAGIYLYRKKRDLFFWFILFFICLLPVSQIVSLVTLMNDRYLYFPMLGAASFYGILAFPPAGASRDSLKKYTAILLCLLVTPLPWLSWQRTAVWSNDVSLWTDTSRKTPGSTLVWISLGMSYLDAGRSDEAVSAFQKALSLDPNDKLALNNIGALYNSRGELVKARPSLLRVVEFFPDYFDGLMNLGINYYLSDEFKNADLTFKKAFMLNPQSPEVISRLGDVSLVMGKIEEAGGYYRAAIELGGSTAYLEYNLARVESLRDRPVEAVERLGASLRMGYRDFQTIMKDTAFIPLRERQDFKNLVKKYIGK